MKLYRESKCFGCDKRIGCDVCPIKTKRAVSLYNYNEKCELSNLKEQYINDNSMLYNDDFITSGLYEEIEISLKVENWGVFTNRKERSIYDHNELTKINFYVNKIKVMGNIGKSVFYIPVLR